MSRHLRRAADAMKERARREAMAASPRPERFRVIGTGPLRLYGERVEVELHEEDPDVEVHDAVQRAQLVRDDVVWVHPQPDEAGREIESWEVAAVAHSSGAPGAHPHVFTAATLPDPADYTGQLIFVSDGGGGARVRYSTGAAWVSLG